MSRDTRRIGQEREGARTADEEQLVQAAQRNVAAFGPLYARYQDRLYTYLRTRTGTAEDAADLTQQVFVQALDALPRYRSQGVSVAAWLFRIARNAAIDWQRRQRPTMPWETLPEAFHPCAPETADGTLLQREAFAPLYALLAVIAACPDDLLNDPRRLGLPEDMVPWMLVANNSYAHYQEHAQAIRAWLATPPAVRDGGPGDGAAAPERRG